MDYMFVMKKGIDNFLKVFLFGVLLVFCFGVVKAGDNSEVSLFVSSDSEGIIGYECSYNGNRYYNYYGGFSENEKGVYMANFVKRIYEDKSLIRGSDCNFIICDNENMGIFMYLFNNEKLDSEEEFIKDFCDIKEINIPSDIKDEEFFYLKYEDGGMDFEVLPEDELSGNVLPSAVSNKDEISKKIKYQVTKEISRLFNEDDVSYEDDVSLKDECFGCYSNDLGCINFNYRTNMGVYCSEDEGFVPLLGDGDVCEVDSQCESYICNNGECSGISLFSKILVWFKTNF